MEMLVWGIIYLVSAPIIFSPTIVYLVAIPRVVRYASNFQTTISACILAAYIFVPLGLWALSYTSAKNAEHDYQARIDGVPKVSIDRDAPDVLLIARHGVPLFQDDLDALRCQPISKPGSLRAGQLQSVTDQQKPGDGQLSQMPARYLLLDSDSSNPLGPINKATTAGEGPFQLTLVENGKTSLVAFHYIPFHPKPMFPPILTIHGWSHSPNSIKSVREKENVIAFAKQAIGRCIDFEAYAVDLPRRSKLQRDRK